VAESQAHLRRDLLPENRRFLPSNSGWSSGDFGDDVYEDLRGEGAGLGQGGGRAQGAEGEEGE